MSAKCFLFSLSFVFSVLMHFDAVAAQNSTTITGDHLALLDIKSMIKDDPLGVMTSWNHSSTNFCQWLGVTCSHRHQRVTQLRLSSRGLNGRLSPSIGNLSFLRVISLYNNSFYGEIPPEIGLLFRLRGLNLYHNNFTGNIPEAITNCSNLRALDLGYNNLVGKIPAGIGSLTMLNTLYLPRNTLKGGIPLSIANLTLLKEFSVGDCQLGGNFPDVFQSMTNLRYLELPGNNLVGILPPFYNCSSLEFVSLERNQLTGRLHIKLGATMPHLKSLFLTDNRLTALDISNTSISPLMPNLMYLDISLNDIQGALNFVDIPTTLKVIDLSSNEFSGSLDHFLCSNGVKNIQCLNLRNNHFSGVIPGCWEKWPSLELLSLENNILSGEIPITLGSLHSLQYLNMGGNNISGRLPSSLMNLTYLKILQLDRNELVGSIPTWIGTKLTLLRLLKLRSNNFNGNIPHELCYLSHAQILDLGHNILSGNIPRCFNNFSVLSGKEANLEIQFSFNFSNQIYIATDLLMMKGREDNYDSFLGLVMLLDLSSNQISGHIPSELTSLHALKSLNLSRNQLTGRIPEMIGDMKALESFDLSLNKLSGELPMSLSRLTFLSGFNVSYNNLIGRVPTSTQIQSFNESSFFGNKLCGAPLPNGCVPVEVPDTIRNQKEDDGSHGADWGLIISIVIGFVIGFWISHFINS